MFVSNGDGEVARVCRHGGWAALLVIDVDRFTLVNDSLGHRAGDDVLQAWRGHSSAACAQTTSFPASAATSSPVIAVATEGEAATRCPASELAATLREQTILTSGRDQIVHAA